MPPASEPSRQTAVSISTTPSACSAHIGQPADEGIETIVRLIDLGGLSRIVTINVPLFSIDKIVFTDAVELDQKPIDSDSPHSLKIAVQPYQIVTIRLIAG